MDINIMVHPRRRRQQTAAAPMTSSSSSLLLLILHHLRLCWNYLLSFLRSGGGNNNTRIISLTNLFQSSSSHRRQLTFDNGTQVTIGDQIAEGGFSYVFEAFPANSSSSPTTKKKYALKRINCADQELLQSCHHEAGIHRSLPSNHPNLLELLGLKFEQDLTSGSSSSVGSSILPEEYNVCFMLFPYLPNSLRGEITKRNILNQDDDPNDGSNSNNHYRYNNNAQATTRRQRQPFTTVEVIHLFRGILDALLAMHNTNISHRDVKLENVLLSSSSSLSMSYADHQHRRHSKYTPILMDYGSAGPLSTPPLNTRHSILNLIEVASTHTTFSYRPPELSDVGNLSASNSCIVDYGKVDVWSLGCVLFGLLHGASPFEMEFVKNDSGGYGYGRRSREVEDQEEQYGLVRIVECTTLKILGEVPFPPWVGSGLGGNNTHTNNNNNNNENVGDGSNGKYPLSIYKFIRYMVQHDRMLRPNIYEVAKRFGELHLELMGEEWIPYSSNDDGGRGRSMSSLKVDGGVEEEEEREHDDFDSLIASRDFV
jgi:serine/threonine kinase 16